MLDRLVGGMPDDDTLSKARRPASRGWSGTRTPGRRRLWGRRWPMQFARSSARPLSPRRNPPKSGGPFHALLSGCIPEAKPGMNLGLGQEKSRSRRLQYCQTTDFLLNLGVPRGRLTAVPVNPFTSDTCVTIARWHCTGGLYQSATLLLQCSERASDLPGGRMPLGSSLPRRKESPISRRRVRLNERLALP